MLLLIEKGAKLGDQDILEVDYENKEQMDTKNYMQDRTFYDQRNIDGGFSAGEPTCRMPTCGEAILCDTNFNETKISYREKTVIIKFEEID